MRQLKLRAKTRSCMQGPNKEHPRSGYSPIEGEALTVANALDKARFFLLGCSDWTVAVNHKPLLKVLCDRSLEDIPNARLRNVKEKTLHYRFRMVYIPGIRHKSADAISHHPTGPKTPEMLILPDDIATTSDSPTPPPPDPYQCSFLDHIPCDKLPFALCSLAINDQLASSASSALRTIAVPTQRATISSCATSIPLPVHMC